MIKLICECDGKQFAMENNDAYILKSITGITSTEYDVITNSNAYIDGETYSDSFAKMRNIIISLYIKDNFISRKDNLFAFFQPRRKGTLYFFEDEAPGKKITYYPESIEIDPSGNPRLITISLLCPNPLFSAIEDIHTQMASWEGLISFDIELPFEFETEIRHDSLIVNIDNPSNVARGLTILFKASGTVHHPALLDIERQTSFVIEQEMHAGDIIKVTTGHNEKRVFFISSNGLEVPINHCWKYGSTWLQAEPGNNVYRYDAESDIQNLEVTIYSTPAYWGG